jgi:hypothetical protein
MKIQCIILGTAVFALSILSSHTRIEKLSGSLGESLRVHAAFEGTPRNAQQMVAAGYKRYGVEKGTLVFQYTGAVSGTDYIYFDNWGWREAKYTRTKTEIGTFKEEANMVQYIDGENRNMYNPATNKTRYFDGRQAIVVADKYGTKDMVAFNDVLTRNMGGRPDGKVMVGNIECDAWYIEKHQAHLFMWQGITMGEESYVNGIMVGRTCTSIELKKNPPLDKLVLPKGAVLEVRK